MFSIQVSNRNITVHVQIANTNLFRILIFCDMSEENVSRNIPNGRKYVERKKNWR